MSNEQTTDGCTETASNRLRELSVEECWELLGTERVGRVVTDWDRLEIFPVNFSVHNGNIVFRTVRGTKLGASVLSREILFEVDHYDEDDQTGWSVVVRGRGTEVQALGGYLTLVGLTLDAWTGDDRDRIVRITVKSISGRTITPAPAPSVSITRRHDG